MSQGELRREMPAIGEDVSLYWRIKKIKGPAGTDIGAQTAGEIALSMISEIVASKHGKININNK